jgi:hypothetical protein
LLPNVFVTVPTSLPSFMRPTARKFIAGTFGSGLAHGAVDVATELSASNVAVYAHGVFEPSTVSVPLRPSALSDVQRVVTESLVAPIVMPFHLPASWAAVSAAGAGAIAGAAATAAVSVAGFSALEHATSTPASRRIFRMEPS